MNMIGVVCTIPGSLAVCRKGPLCDVAATGTGCGKVGEGIERKAPVKCAICHGNFTLNQAGECKPQTCKPGRRR